MITLFYDNIFVHLHRVNENINENIINYLLLQLTYFLALTTIRVLTDSFENRLFPPFGSIVNHEIVKIHRRRAYREIE